MTWIREAEDDRRRLAQDIELNRLKAEQDRAAFDAEDPVTPEQVVDFLRPFQDVVVSVVADLESAGYGVEQSGPDFLYGYEEKDKKPGYSDQFTLIRNRPESFGHNREYAIRAIDIFGIDWIIKHGQEHLGTLRILPTVSESTHFGGVEYRASRKVWPESTDYTRQVSPGVDTQDAIVEDLQKTVANWIRSFQAPQPATSSA